MNKRYLVTHTGGLPGLGKEPGATFEADDARDDIRILLALDQIKEAPTEMRKELDLQPSPTVGTAKATATTAATSLEDASSDSSASTPRSRRYERRDQRAEDE